MFTRLYQTTLRLREAMQSVQIIEMKVNYKCNFVAQYIRLVAIRNVISFSLTHQRGRHIYPSAWALHARYLARGVPGESNEIPVSGMFREATDIFTGDVSTGAKYRPLQLE